MSELYISIDIEADGPIPGKYSMLSLGAVALDIDCVERGRFSVNLETLQFAEQDPETMDWWKRQPAAWAACRTNLQDPKSAMREFHSWVERFKDKNYRPIPVCAPSGFDFTFVYWYLMSFVGNSPFGFSCIDMRSFVMGMRNANFFQTSKRYWPKRWFAEDAPHNHIAVDDAYEQGVSFIRALREQRGLKP